MAGYNVYRAASAAGPFTKVNATLLTGTTYADAAAPQGAPSFYQVTAVDRAGNDSAPSTTVNATRPDSTPPAQLTGVTATGSTAGIALAWSASAATDLAGYNVYRSASATGTFTKVNAAVITGATFTDTAAPQGLASHYQVTAVDTAGNESVRSATVNAVRPDSTPPGVTTGVSATGTAAGITVGWSANGAADLAGYNVYRSATAAGTFTKVNATLVTGTSFADTTAPQGAASYYQVTAVDASGNESVRSATVNAVRPDSTPPGVTTGVTATGSATGIAVAWTANAAPDLAGYNVYRSASATGTYTKVNAALVTGTSYNDAAAPQGAASYYQVTAVDASGNESVRSATANATRPDTTAPAVLTGVTATGSAAAIALAWSGSAATDLAGYNVYRSASATGTYTKLNAALVTGASYSDTTAPVGVASYYQVTAVDNAGNESARSATVNATRTGGTTPSTVRINAGGPAVTTGGVSWLANQFFSGGRPYSNPSATAIAGTTDDVLYRDEHSAGTNGGSFSYAIPVTNGTYDIRLHFAEIYWGAPGGGAGGTGKRVFSVNVEGGAVEVANLDLNAVAAPATAVLRNVRATITDGTVNIAFTSQVNQATIAAIEVLPADTTAPAVPTGVAASGAATGITTTWSAVSAPDLAGYNVYRSTSATGTFTKLTASPVTGTSYADTSAPAGATSFYRVTSIDRSNNESAQSATVSAARPAAPRPTIRINTGGPAQTVSGTSWSACTSVTACSNWVSGGFAHSESDTITGIPAGMNNTMFQSEWTGGAVGGVVVPVGSRAFGFNVPVANGNYTVRLHFAELNKTAANARTFDVRLENTTVLSNFDVFAQAAGIDKAIVRQFPVTVADGAVTIDFIRRIENAKISAIEIIPVG